MDSAIVCAVFCLENSFCSWYIVILAVLWICSTNKSLWTVRAFHPEFIYFSWVEIVYPSFNGIKPDSLSSHVTATLASNMKRSFISHFTSSNSLALNYFKWLVFGKLAFFGRNFIRVVVFRKIKIVCSGCSKCTHF